jgi:hypothetical protein
VYRVITYRDVNVTFDHYMSRDAFLFTRTTPGTTMPEQENEHEPGIEKALPLLAQYLNVLHGNLSGVVRRVGVAYGDPAFHEGQTGHELEMQLRTWGVSGRRLVASYATGASLSAAVRALLEKDAESLKTALRADRTRPAWPIFDSSARLLREYVKHLRTTCDRPIYTPNGLVIMVLEAGGHAETDAYLRENHGFSPRDYVFQNISKDVPNKRACDLTAAEVNAINTAIHAAWNAVGASEIACASAVAIAKGITLRNRTYTMSKAIESTTALYDAEMARLESAARAALETLATRGTPLQFKPADLNIHAPQTPLTKETPVPETKTAPEPTKTAGPVKRAVRKAAARTRQDAGDAATRVAARQLVKAARAPLAGILAARVTKGRGKAKTEKQILALLESPEGLGVLKYAIGAALGASPLATYVENVSMTYDGSEQVTTTYVSPTNRLAEVADALRIEGMTDLGDAAADLLTGPLFKSCEGLVAMVLTMSKEPAQLGEPAEKVSFAEGAKETAAK